MKASRSLNPALQRLQVILSLILIASMVTGCQIPWLISPTNTPVETEESLPTEEASETPEPQVELPPALVEVQPLPKSVIDLQQPLTLYFNQPMDTDSVNAAIHFDPDISGSFSWQKDQILTFTPDQPLPPETQLMVSIMETAQAKNTKTLLGPVELEFNTSAYLNVTQTLPMDESEEIDPNNIVLVTFNQPVVALGAEADGEPAFTLSPQVDGQGEWLNTSTYIFYPDPSLDGGATYTATLNESLTSASGAALSPNTITSFSFTTTTPAITYIQPKITDNLRLDGPIRVMFNIQMDPQSVESAFSMTAPDGMDIKGSFEWDEENLGFKFFPNTLLSYNTTYTIRVGTEATSFGGLPLGSPIETTRQTYPTFGWDASTAADFNQYYGEYGAYKIPFTAPLEKTNYEDYLTIDPEINSLTIYSGLQDNTLTLNGYFKPQTEYSLTISGDLSDAWGTPLGEDLTLTFNTPPADPMMTVLTGSFSSQLVFVPANTSELVLQATNISSVTLDLSPITVEDLITLLHPDNYDYRQTFYPESLARTTINLSLEPNQNQVITVPLQYQDADLTPGVYFLQLSSDDLGSGDPNNYRRFFVIVSQNNVVMKNAPDQALVWATNLDDFSPISEAPVVIYSTEGTRLASGQTNDTGLFISDYERISEPYSAFFTLVGEPGQENFGFSSSDWNQNHNLYQMGINFNSLPPMIDAYIYTDRPIYRPGDTVNFRAVVFGLENGLPTDPEDKNVQITIYSDPGMSGVSTELFSEEMTLSDFGTVDGAVTLPENATPGYYHISLSVDEMPISALYFDVAAYRKPEFELALSTDDDQILNGENLAVSLQADYYFGMPLNEENFSWTLYQDATYFHLPGYRVGPMNTNWLMPRMDIYGPSFGTSIGSGSGLTDEFGYAEIDFDDFPDEGLGGRIQKLTLEVTINDDSGFPVSQQEQVLLHPEAFYIGVKPDSYFGTAETEFNFSVLTVDWQKNPVSDIPLEATFEKIEWEVETTTDPTMPYRYTTVTTPVSSATPITNADGEARLSFTPPDPGTYQLTVESGGALTQALVWVSGSSTAIWPQQQQNRITLTPDAESYQPGQIAKIFFPNPFPEGCKALVTIERGRIMETQILEISGSGYTLELPLNSDAIPNIYVSVMLLGQNEDGNPDYRQGIVNLPVAPINKKLNVSLTLDPDETTPGSTVSATLTITDQSGQPVQGAFSIAVVDKAVLALKDPNSPPIMDALYGTQPLSVKTSFSLLTYATQLSLISMDVGRGGGGGDMAAPPELREDFPDTAFWQAEVVTAADGTALLEIPMPDSLTTWVVDVRGLTENYLAGQTTAEIITNKDLMIRPVTPRFLVDGDIVQMAAVVHNNTDESLLVDVSLQQSTGFTLDEDANITQQVEIPAGENRRVTWWGTVESVSSVELIFQATAGALSDASTPIWGELPVLQYTTPLTFSTAGELSEESELLELVSLPISVDPESGSLTVELTPSLTSTLVNGLEALETSSYADTVSVLSRLLANLSAYQALNNLDIDSPQLESNLETLATEGLNQLIAAQNIDGGWSWWPHPDNYNQQSDPFITAYALMGLQKAQEAGLEVNSYLLERTVEYLQTKLTQPGQLDTPWQLDRLVFEIYALREAPINLMPYIEGLYGRRSELSPWSLALLALMIDARDFNNNRVNTLLTDLEGQAVRSATGVYWESDKGSWLLPGTPLFNTALSVFTLARLDPASESLPAALRYLMVHRNTNQLWGSSFESAWALMAITEALLGTGDYQADFDFNVTLNDTAIAEGTADGTSNLTPITVNTPIASLNADSPNALVINRSAGSGTLYYRADLQTTQFASSAPAINKGISLKRDYYYNTADCENLQDCPTIDGLTLDPEQPAQIVTVVLTIIAPHDMYNLLVEDFIPAGAEILNKDLNTTIQATEEVPVTLTDETSWIRRGWGWWYFDSPQIYDDHLLWTADYIPAGTYVLTYQILPYQQGVYQVLPAHAWQYFYPEVQGTTTGDIFTIE